jgi:hypothetical protein
MNKNSLNHPKPIKTRKINPKIKFARATNPLLNFLKLPLGPYSISEQTLFFPWCFLMSND